MKKKKTNRDSEAIFYVALLSVVIFAGSFLLIHLIIHSDLMVARNDHDSNDRLESYAGPENGPDGSGTLALSGFEEGDACLSGCLADHGDGIVQAMSITIDEEPEEVEPIQILISAVGDCTLGYDPAFGTANRFDTVYNNQGPDYFFSKVLPIFSADDLTIANLETTFTRSTNKASKAFTFKGDPSYARILEKGGIDVVGLANNHTYDYFQQGYDDTINALEQTSVNYFGYDAYTIINVKEVNVGIGGFQIGRGDWSDHEQAISEMLSTLKDEADLVIMSFHWGIEGDYTPTSYQKSLARFCIDNGADLVIGHHPHVIQGIEHYNGRHVAYSLANFSFGGNSNPNDKDTMIFQQTFEFHPRTKELLTVSEPNIIPASESSVQTRNDYRPTPLEGAEAERVLEKIRKYSEQIN